MTFNVSGIGRSGATQGTTVSMLAKIHLTSFDGLANGKGIEVTEMRFHEHEKMNAAYEGLA